MTHIQNMYFKRITLILTALLTLSFQAEAQFSTAGDDPGGIVWSRMNTDNFKIIYPTGLDSLARLYGMQLEMARKPLSLSCGFAIGENYKAKMPVILHAWNIVSNASVVWAPKRMDIFTIPDPYSPTPIPWEKELAIHEGRHASQMQFGAEGKFKVMHWLTGEMFAGAMAGIYPGPALLEGDAVVAETALTSSGRGRQASFLNYMMPAFDSGDWKDYWQWSHDSQKTFIPDHYKVGYMTVAGSRVFFDDPCFMGDYFRKAVRNCRFFNLQKTMKKASGMKFKKAFRTIEEGFQSTWNEDAGKRGPFMASRQVSPEALRSTFYSKGVQASNGDIFTIRNGIASTTALVKLSQDGKEKRIRSFASTTSHLYNDPAKGRIYWTENIQDRRWQLKGTSQVRYIETSDPKRIHILSSGKRYFNSAPSPDGKILSVTEYPVGGGSAICMLESTSGDLLKRYIAPDGIQFLESAWIGVRLFVSGVAEDGSGIWELTGLSSEGKAMLKTVESPQPVELTNLGGWSGKPWLTFVCDRTGVNEMYAIDVVSGALKQLTDTRYGISSPMLNQAADTLYYSSVAASDKPESYRQGTMMYSTAVKDLPIHDADFSKIHSYRIADALTSQESALQQQAGKDTSSIKFSEPHTHFKFQPPHIHSWAPIYFNYNNVDDISMDEYYESASLGATAVFQNLLGNGYGFVGYSFHEDPLGGSAWRNSLHFDYIYSGFYPVIELTGDWGDRNCENICRVLAEKEGSTSFFTNGKIVENSNYFTGNLKIYVPLIFSSSGLSRGIIPQFKYKFSNDIYDNGIQKWTWSERKDGSKGYIKGNNIFSGDSDYLQTMDLSVRGYLMRKVATSQIYPRLGVGAELGFHTRPGHSEAFRNMAYLYTYGYLPGILPTQGIKLTAGFEKDLGGGEYSLPDGILSTTPRGLVNSNLRSIQNRNASFKMKVTADYAIPFLPADWSFLGPLAYIRNFVLTPFYDISYQSYTSHPDLNLNPDGIKDEVMMSIGADLTVHLGNFLWLPYDTEIGIRYARNSWQHLDELSTTGLDKNYIGWIFSIDI